MIISHEYKLTMRVRQIQLVIHPFGACVWGMFNIVRQRFFTCDIYCIQGRLKSGSRGDVLTIDTSRKSQPAIPPIISCYVGENISYYVEFFAAFPTFTPKTMSVP